MIGLHKIIYEPTYFYNFQKNNWDCNENSSRRNDLVLYLRELTLEEARTIISTPSMSTSDCAIFPILELDIKRKNFLRQYDKSRSVRELINLFYQNFYVFLTENNKRTIFWKEFLEKI